MSASSAHSKVNEIDIFSQMLRIGFFDPAGTNSRADLKKVRSRCAVVIIGLDHLHRIYALDSWAGRPTGDTMLDKVVEICAKMTPKTLGVESNACQSQFGAMLRTRLSDAGIPTKVRSVNQPSSLQKPFRIRTVIGEALREGRLFIPERMFELRAEMRGFPTAAHQDLIDALASAITMAPKRPKQISDSAEIREYAAYLRKSGLPNVEIERRVQELREANNGQHD